MTTRTILGQDGYLDTSKPIKGGAEKKLVSNNNTYSNEFLASWHKKKELENSNKLKPKM